MSDELAGRADNKYLEHRPWQDLDTMLTVDEARFRILAAIEQCETEPVELADAHGLVLAETVVADDPVPPFRNSAMDGYAVRAEDLGGATPETPVSLTVVGELAAGHEPDRPVSSGEAVRIMTGAVLPEGADTVVRFEETSEFDSGSPIREGVDGLSMVEIVKAPRQGDNVREAGEDIASQSEVLHAGTLLGAAELGVLASVNRSRVRAVRRPLVGILATGDEVVDPGDPLRPGQIRNSNNYTVAGLVREAGGVPCMLGIASDSTAALRSKLENVSRFDLLITSGGVSLGDYDVVKDVLQAEGSIELWQVRIKPGKPMAFGHIGGVPLIGLPGNPVAAYVAFLQFGKPAIHRLRGMAETPVATRRARLLCEHENRGHRRHFVRAMYYERSGELVVEPVAVQGSGVLSSVTGANCLFVIPEDLSHAPAGTTVDVIPLDGCH